MALAARIQQQSLLVWHPAFLLEKAIKQGKKFVTESIGRHFRWISPRGYTVDALKQFRL